jgi:hypothetical protein
VTDDERERLVRVRVASMERAMALGMRDLARACDTGTTRSELIEAAAAEIAGRFDLTLAEARWAAMAGMLAISVIHAMQSDEAEQPG